MITPLRFAAVVGAVLLVYAALTGLDRFWSWRLAERQAAAQAWLDAGERHRAERAALLDLVHQLQAKASAHTETRKVATGTARQLVAQLPPAPQLPALLVAIDAMEAEADTAEQLLRAALDSALTGWAKDTVRLHDGEVAMAALLKSTRAPLLSAAIGLAVPVDELAAVHARLGLSTSVRVAGARWQVTVERLQPLQPGGEVRHQVRVERALRVL